MPEMKTEEEERTAGVQLQLEEIQEQFERLVMSARARFYGRYSDVAFKKATEGATLDRCAALCHAALAICGHPRFEWESVEAEDWTDTELEFLARFAREEWR